MYLIQQTCNIQSCDRPIILLYIYVGVNKQRQFQLLPRERKKFLNIPEGKKCCYHPEKERNIR